MGYHKAEIKKGKYGTMSKLIEEIEEYEDAINQNNIIMAQIELSDIYGALEKMAEKHGRTMKDLQIMSDATKSAFKDGTRK